MSKKRIVLLACLALVLAVSCVLAVACGSDGDYTVTWDLGEHVESVTIEGYDYDQEMGFDEGEVINFTVKCETGYEVESVKVGGGSIKATNGVYKHTVKQNVTITITARKALSRIEVELKEAGKQFYAGHTVDTNDLKVTAHWAVGEPTVETTNIGVIYNNGEKLSLGDRSITVTFGGKSQVLEIEAVKGLITLNLAGGHFEAEELAKLDERFTKVSDSEYRLVFAQALTEDIELPTPTLLLDEGNPDSALFFQRWSGEGVEDNKIKATNTSVTAAALFDATLVDVTEMKFVEKNGKPYLEIKGEFKAATSAYLFLYEGNNPPVEYAKHTEAVSTDGKTFTLDLDLLEFIAATPINPDTKQPMEGASFLGKWMDIRFCVEYGDTIIQQELFVSDDMTYADLGDQIVARGEDGKLYRFFYETYNPEPGHEITGVPGATFTGEEKILKLHCEETQPYVFEQYTLEIRGGLPYFVIRGRVFVTKEQAEATLEGYIEDLQNFTAGQSDVGIAGMQTLVVNEDLTFEIALCIDVIRESGSYVMHCHNGIGSQDSNVNPSNYDKTVSITVGTRTYTLGKVETGWGWDWTCIKCVNTAYDQNKSVILDEDGKPYFILMGEAGEKSAEEIKGMIDQFDFELDGGDANNPIKIDLSKVTVTITDGIYTVKVDVSELPVGKYWVHIYWSGEKNDIQPDASKPSVTYEDKIYQGLDDQKDWGVAHLLEVRDAGAPVIEVNSTLTLEKGEDEKMYLVITGTYENCDSAEALKPILTIDVENPDNGWNKTYLEFDVTIDAEHGTFTIKVDISSLANGQYLAHVNGDDVGNENGISAIETGGKSYSYEHRAFDGWTRFVLTIRDAQ